MSVLSYYENLTLASNAHGEILRPKRVFGDSFCYQKDIKGHTGCVNAIEFSPDEELVVSGGDDMRTIVWRTGDLMLDDNPKPCATMKHLHLSNIFANRFDITGTKLYSGGNDCNVVLHDVESTESLRVFNFSGSVYCIDVNPSDEKLFSVCTEDGLVRFFDNRDYKRCVLDISNIGSNVYCGQYSPSYAPAFVVAGSRCGVRLYDLRNIKRDNQRRQDTKPVCKLLEQGAMYACWNSLGSALAVLSANKNPIYIELMDKKKILQLDDSGYENNHTIKSIEFMNDSTVITGSDDFKLYAWNVVGRFHTANDEEGTEKESNDEYVVTHADEIFEVRNIAEADFILQGHRSIVNQVRYSAQNNIIITSGVEKILKCWSTLEIPKGYTTPNVRRVGCFAPPPVYMEIGRRTAAEVIAEADAESSSDDDDSDEDDMGVEDEMAEDRAMLNYFDRMIMSERRFVQITGRRRFPRRERIEPPSPMSTSSDDSDGIHINLPGVDVNMIFGEQNENDLNDSDEMSLDDSSNADENANLESDSDSSDNDAEEPDRIPRPIRVFPPDSSPEPEPGGDNDD